MRKRKRETLDDFEPTKRNRSKSKKTNKSKKKKDYKYAHPKTRSKLDDDLIEKICEYTAKGHSLAEIANYLCITPSLFYDWRRKGEAYNTEKSTVPQWEIFGRFVTALRKAAADYTMEQERKLHNGSVFDWPRRFKILQTRSPSVWGTAGRPGADEDFTPDEAYL